MSKRDFHLLVDDILQSAIKIKIYSKDLSFDVFIKDGKTFDAVVRNFTIIGEASNRIDNDIKMKFPLIDWNEIRGLRNRIVHEYFGIDNQILWEIIENELDYLIENLELIKSKL
ncbi:DUF86 domain-containing protein [Flavobacterium sp.]|jgi:uncharacterized protein with HEPN domain|uniref:DUF86 domain-containing protein n=1 Tax=Flavobacterium sp. TaxID=239 RepID=UPI0037BF4248